MQRIRQHYQLLPSLILRDIRERFSGSALGALWALLHPLALIALYYTAFSVILKVPAPSGTREDSFAMFLLSGLIPWLAFSESLQRSSGAIVERAAMVKKVMFPAQLLPLSAALAPYVTLGGTTMLVALGGWAALGAFALPGLMGLMLALACQAAASAGLALLVSALVVYLRDLSQLIGLLLQVMFYTTTVIFPLEHVPASIRPLVAANPFTPFAETYHHAILHGALPPAPYLAYMVLLSGGMLFLGRAVFRSLRPGFADAL